MRTTYTLKTAFSALLRNRSRTALTILGIVIGVPAIILVVSIGESAEGLILGEIEGFGTKTLYIEPGREQTGPGDFAGLFSDSLKKPELEALRRKENIPDATSVEPNVYTAVIATYAEESQTVDISGVSDIQDETLGLTVEPNGRFLDKTDVDSYARVAVLGIEVKEDLFGLDEAVGKRIKLKEQSFQVIGVMESGQGSLFFDADNQVLVPYTSAQRYLTGTSHYNAIVVEVGTEEAVARAKTDIERTLRLEHDITDPDKDDFHVSTQEDAAEAIGAITGTLSALLGSVAAISLVVGGIGIMNIMLVSVTERTREIGLRKALGARSKDILRQFLVEAVTLTGVGGILGIALGVLLAYLASIVISGLIGSEWPFIFSVPAAILGIGVSAAIGLVFGLYPARQAAKKSPIEALRYE